MRATLNARMIALRNLALTSSPAALQAEQAVLQRQAATCAAALEMLDLDPAQMKWREALIGLLDIIEQRNRAMADAAAADALHGQAGSLARVVSVFRLAQPASAGRVAPFVPLPVKAQRLPQSGAGLRRAA